MPFTNIQGTQNDFLVNYLRGTGRTLTARQADALYGIKRLPARISELKSEGYRIRKTVNTQGRVAYAISRRMSQEYKDTVHALRSVANLNWFRS